MQKLLLFSWSMLDRMTQSKQIRCQYPITVSSWQLLIRSLLITFSMKTFFRFKQMCKKYRMLIPIHILNKNLHFFLVSIVNGQQSVTKSWFTFVLVHTEERSHLYTILSKSMFKIFFMPTFFHELKHF